MRERRGILTYLEWFIWLLIALCFAARLSDVWPAGGTFALPLIGLAMALRGACGVRRARDRSKAGHEAPVWGVLASLPSLALLLFGGIVVTGFLYLAHAAPAATAPEQRSETVRAAEGMTPAEHATTDREPEKRTSRGPGFGPTGRLLFLGFIVMGFGLIGVQWLRYGGFTGMQLESRVEAELGTTPWREQRGERVRHRLVRLKDGDLGLLVSTGSPFIPDSTLRLTIEQAVDLRALLQRAGDPGSNEEKRPA
jgi:hypothetical protein